MSLGAPPAPIHVELREPGDVQARSLTCDETWTIAQVKHALPALWQPHTLDPRGVRCIHRGQVLDDDVRLDTLPRDDAHRLVLHIAIRPGALEHAATPPPPADTPAAPAAPAIDPLLASGYFRTPSSNPLCEFVVRVKPSELIPLAHALAITYTCYARYYDALALATHSDARAARLVRPVGVPWAPMEEALGDAALRTAAVTFIEREVMQWTPLHELSVAPAASVDDVRERQAAIDARLVFLNDALLAIAHLHDMHTWRAQTPSTPPAAHAQDPWELVMDIGVAARTVLGLVLRMVVLVSLFALRAPPYVRWCACVSLAVYAVVHGVMLVHARRRARGTPPRPAGTSASAPAGERALRDTTAAEVDTGAAILELPHLPSRVPAGPWWAPTRWEQALAYYGLADEEQAMGFVHDATRDAVPRIHWAPHDFGEPETEVPHTPPRAPSALYTYVALPVYLFIVTLLPRVQELRADALALRRDAICSLAQKWEQLAQSGRPVRRTKPRILEHPYARRVLAAQARRP
ncbi:hypothetical protein MBRA1_000241 [Malassezia brasiliensis]|uniref:Ubiquitin-like domain-containing protein n=1 Tax=Malassezia brasiliensis TaxID=1821822 RepID=A0AAF0DPI3_9BASI|nr:hypothetical protein MBRA1_000241 [Malassezia brasiliensis]